MRAQAATCDAMEPPIFVDGAGHWIQQERPDLVNEMLLAFAGKHVALFTQPQATSHKL
eukprot:SAG25_NODE_26_length_21086_cov_21.643065_5_plen_58_part_00